MRIAYITPYQGASLDHNRPILLNRSLANTAKIELVAKLLQSMSHDVQLISEGGVDKPRWRYFPSFRERQPFHPDIPVVYSAALPIRYLNGLFSSIFMLQQFKSSHQARSFDLVIIYDMRTPNIACANYAMRRLGLPVILEYEDDSFVTLHGAQKEGFRANRRAKTLQRFLKEVSGCFAASPYLLSQLPSNTPGFILRGVVGADLLSAATHVTAERKNWVLFSGTHDRGKGIPQLINAWKMARLADWELHITGTGELSEELHNQARDTRSIVFHGLVDRKEMVRLLCSAKICMNPHNLSTTPGNVFAFKLVEYLAGGNHVITTPMGALEQAMECGLTYLPDNQAATIAATLRRVVQDRLWLQTAPDYVCKTYGPNAVAKALDELLCQVTSNSQSARFC